MDAGGGETGAGCVNIIALNNGSEVCSEPTSSFRKRYRRPYSVILGTSSRMTSDCRGDGAASV
ncbi:hypothetical protein AGR2A_Lc30158 [Agrobacterium genomosp. 2 str. CFBP 5494]|uniref:Uncharacterized protein n=1 Tax=Agrobacterium genomosp. 2 str. CFBP 5494 TaxID=1183436 RepID=A0A9W5B4P5_9HYPH|nr:hypothetical protein AGR2A_Lc30158 [Agrobacterium genomosp. 2 str. CFBP 5494]